MVAYRPGTPRDPVHGAGLLRVGEGDGGELRVGCRLAVHDGRIREAGGPHRGAQHLRADPVQRCVGDRQVPVRVPVHDPRHTVHIGRHDRLGQHRTGRTEGYRGQRPHRPDRRLDLRVGRGDDLRPGAGIATEGGPEVDLVPVVPGRVVARGHHDARHRVEAAHGEREDRRGQRPGQDERLPPGAGHHPRGLVGELPRAVPRVVPDDHRPGRTGGTQPADHARGGRPYHRPVHPVGTGPQRAAQPGRPEGQRAREAVGELGGGVGQAVEDLAQLGAVVPVRVVGQPRRRLFLQPRQVHAHVDSTAGRSGGLVQPVRLRGMVVDDPALAEAGVGDREVELVGLALGDRGPPQPVPHVRA